MANNDNARGFIAQPPMLHVGHYDQPASDGTAVFINDVVDLVSTGHVSPASAGSAVLIGVSGGYSAASTAGSDIPVYDDPGQRYEVQSAGTPAQTNIGNYADHVAGTGDATLYVSGHELSGTMAGTLTGFLILDIVNNPENSFAANADMRVQIHDHIWGKTGV